MFIISKQETDGFGQRYKDIMTCFIFCRMKKHIYVHNPLNRVKHNYKNDKLFDIKLDKFIGFNDYPIQAIKCGKRWKTYRPKIGNFVGKKYNIAKTWKEAIITNKFKLCIFRTSSNSCLSYNIDKIFSNKNVKLLKKIYNKNKKTHLLKSNNKIKIAVHIRYGDISLSCLKSKFRVNKITLKNIGYFTNYFQYFIPFQTYLNNMKKLDKMYKNCQFYIFSQGSINDFKIFKNTNLDIIFCLNLPMEETFHSIVSSNIVLMGVSGFSWCSAVLSNAKVFYIYKNNKYFKSNKAIYHDKERYFVTKSNHKWFLNKWTKIDQVMSSKEHLVRLIKNGISQSYQT